MSLANYYTLFLQILLIQTLYTKEKEIKQSFKIYALEKFTNNPKKFECFRASGNVYTWTYLFKKLQKPFPHLRINVEFVIMGCAFRFHCTLTSVYGRYRLLNSTIV